MTPDIHTLAGAYVLDAIEPDERNMFEDHLAECESCRDEVAALQHATAALADNESVAAPAHLRAAVLAAAARTPQLPPLVESPAPVVRRRWAPRLVAAAAAVVLLAGVGATVAVLDDDSPEAVTASQVFDASDAVVRDIALDGGSLHVGLSKKLGVVALDGSDMPTPPPGKAYQLWLVHNGEATSLSVMEGDATTAVEAIPEQGSSFAVTTEPSGGSDQPTSQPILTLDPASL